MDIKQMFQGSKVLLLASILSFAFVTAVFAMAQQPQPEPEPTEKHSTTLAKAWEKAPEQGQQGIEKGFTASQQGVTTAQQQQQ